MTDGTVQLYHNFSKISKVQEKEDEIYVKDLAFGEGGLFLRSAKIVDEVEYDDFYYIPSIWRSIMSMKVSKKITNLDQNPDV